MLSAILSNMGTGCLSMSGWAPLPSPSSRGTCSLHSSHGRIAMKTIVFFPLSVCV